jgi:hypothetical protein
MVLVRLRMLWWVDAVHCREASKEMEAGQYEKAKQKMLAEAAVSSPHSVHVRDTDIKRKCDRFMHCGKKLCKSLG